MILHVANLGNPVLRKKAQPVSPEKIQDPIFQNFCSDLMESMRFHDGVGLAAPQVFLSQRVVAVWVPPEMDEAGEGLEQAIYINPVITPIGDEMEDGWEGCLSLKDLRGVVPRHVRVHIDALDRTGKPVSLDLNGFSARVFQHELDHLDGIVFVDRMPDTSSLVFLDEMERYGEPGEEGQE